nr:hypothetical protein OH820_17765 [Streptomyces sp. NBC_00857]
MADTERQLTYEDAIRIRREATQLQEQLGRIITEARATKSAAQIARDLELTEGRVHQILRAQRAT